MRHTVYEIVVVVVPIYIIFPAGVYILKNTMVVGGGIKMADGEKN